MTIRKTIVFTFVLIAIVLDRLAKDQETVHTLMTQFDSLMAQGQANVLASGGLGNTSTATAPFAEARGLAQSLSDGKPVTFRFLAATIGVFEIRCTLTADERCKDMRGKLIVTAAH